MKRWPLHTAYFWETAPFFRLLLPFAAGIVAYELSNEYIIAGRSSIIFIAVALLIYTVFVNTKKTTRYPFIIFTLLYSILFAGGYSVSYFGDTRLDKNWYGRSCINSSKYLVRIISTPSEREKTWKIPVTVLNSIDNNTITTVTGKAFLYVYKNEYPLHLNKGDSIVVPGKWQQMTNAGNPYEFDYASYCRRNGILRQQFCNRGDIRLYANNDPEHTTYTDRSHDWCMAQLDKYIPDLKTKGLIQAMLLGDEVNLDDELRQSYAETGIIHIIAISGGNVAIFFIVISFLLRWLKHKKHLWVRYAIALPLVWFYVIMAGSSPSAMRAAMMFSLLAIGIMLQKNNNSLNQLFATAFVLLCVQPMWLFAVGFQLSFVAVLSLILFYTPIYKWLSPVNKIAQLLWGTVAASIAAEILVAPLVVYYFHNFPAMFLVANVAAYLFMGVVLVLGMGVILASFIPAVATFLGLCTAWLVSVFGNIVSWLQNFNPPSFHFLMITEVELVFVYLSIAGVATFFLRKQKPALFAGLSCSVILLFSLCYNEWLALKQEQLVAYNISGMTRVELLRGNYYYVQTPDTGNIKKIKYGTEPMHINSHAWKKGDGQNEIFTVGNKTVLLLNEDIRASSSFPVDYLIINYTGNPDRVELQRIFRPSIMVMGNNYTRKQQDKFANMGEPVHAISKHGAFVLKQ